MADGTHIEWADATWNPVRGCSRVSPGCGGANHEGGCYAEKIAARFSGPGQPFEGFARRTPNGGQWTGKLALVDSALGLPLRWKKPRRIFVNSMSDLFHEALPFRQIDRVIEVAREAPQHTYQILTKRAERLREFARWWCTQHAEASLPSCIWLGVSVEDQERANERIPLLLDTPAAVRFISAEPLLGPVDLDQVSCLDGDRRNKQNVLTRAFHIWGETSNGRGPLREILVKTEPIKTLPHLDWVITGGESGPNARPMHPDWARSLRDQCQAAGVAFFFKQWGEWAPYDRGRIDSAALATPGSTDRPIQRFGKHAAGRRLDGKEHSEFPA